MDTAGFILWHEKVEKNIDGNLIIDNLIVDIWNTTYEKVDVNDINMGKGQNTDFDGERKVFNNFTV